MKADVGWRVGYAASRFVMSLREAFPSFSDFHVNWISPRGMKLGRSKKYSGNSDKIKASAASAAAMSVKDSVAPRRESVDTIRVATGRTGNAVTHQWITIKEGKLSVAV